MAITDLGRVCPVLKGAYNAMTNYEKLDIVTYNGSSYVCKTDSTGNAPTNTTYWLQLAAAGDYAGTATAVCGKNILHNYDFRTPVNQRDVSGTFSTTDSYFYDRWILGVESVTIGSNYLTMANGASIFQYIEGTRLAGVEVCVSVMMGGTVYSNSGTFPTVAGDVTVNTITGFGTFGLGYVNSPGAGFMFVVFLASAARNVQMVKVELGTVSTLGREPPVDYGAELLKCQRYYISFPLSSGIYGTGTSSSTTAYMFAPIPCDMRAIPKVISPAPTIDGRQNGSLIIDGVISTIAFTRGAIRMTVTFPAITASHPIWGFIADNPLQLSAEPYFI